MTDKLRTKTRKFDLCDITFDELPIEEGKEVVCVVVAEGALDILRACNNRGIFPKTGNYGPGKVLDVGYSIGGKIEVEECDAIELSFSEYKRRKRPVTIHQTATYEVELENGTRERVV